MDWWNGGNRGNVGSELEGTPDAGILAQQEFLLAGERSIAGEDRTVLQEDGGADLAFAFGVSVAGESAGPGDVAMARGVEAVPALGERPAGARVEFAKSEEVGSDVLLGTREALFGDGELVHQAEAEVLLLRGEVDLEEAAAEAAGGFPTDLAAETGFVAGTLKFRDLFEEEEQDGLQFRGMKTHVV